MTFGKTPLRAATGSGPAACKAKAPRLPTISGNTGFMTHEGNVGADFDANYGYDAAGRQNSFQLRMRTVGGWPTQHPQQSGDGDLANV